MPQKVLVVGATGLIGTEVVKALPDGIITASRHGSQETVDITDRQSLLALFERIGHVDAVISVAGEVGYAPWADISDADWDRSISNKLMGQVNLTRIAAPWVREGGSITLTSGVFAQYPMPGSSIVTTVNAAIEGFVRAAAGEIGRGIRVNAISPGWIKETLQALGMDPSPGVSATEVAAAYIPLLTSTDNGTIVMVAKGL